MITDLDVNETMKQCRHPLQTAVALLGLMLEQWPLADNTSLILLYSLTTIESIATPTPSQFMQGSHLLQSYDPRIVQIKAA